MTNDSLFSVVLNHKILLLKSQNFRYYSNIIENTRTTQPLSFCRTDSPRPDLRQFLQFCHQTSKDVRVETTKPFYVRQGPPERCTKENVLSKSS